jgi:hypothetical protein
MGVRLGSLFCLVGGVLWLMGAPALLAFSYWGGVVLFFHYFFIRGFTWFRWYRPEPFEGNWTGNNFPRAGIEDHFDKVSVITVWLCFWGGIFSLALGWSWLPFVLGIPLAIILVFNIILVVFHWRDSDPMAPNALSGSTRIF